MIKYFINIAYTSDPDVISFTMDEKGSITKFLSFCMHATGVRRLFDKETTREFLWRLAIMFRHYDIVDRFFISDRLIAYDDRGIKNELCLKDVTDHLGLELWDRSNHMVNREEWLGKIKEYWMNACRIAIFTGLPILDKRIIGKNKFIIGSNIPKPIAAEFEKTASLFADEAIRTIGIKKFVELSKRIIERKKYLDQFEARLQIKPEHTFNFLEIPLEKRILMYNKLFPGITIKEDVIKEEINEPESMFAALVQLAWLWVNGYVNQQKILSEDGKYSYFAEVDERFNFDYKKYDGLNSVEFGINIYDTYYDFSLSKIAHMLKEKNNTKTQ